jgi:hypothetical protein
MVTVTIFSSGPLPHLALARGEERHRFGDVLLEVRRLLVRLEGRSSSYTS